ncbi:hypothetical protein, partial [Bradyrhizobium ivorense]|uniref:hypothetical protein n=1 Tax=Bradyrhizobium ivorense TaxID=2511166 RepID=UPI001E3EE70F
MGVSRRLRSKWREQIPTRFALASKATSPFQGEVGAVAWMERSDRRGRPGYRSAHPRCDLPDIRFRTRFTGL